MTNGHFEGLVPFFFSRMCLHYLQRFQDHELFEPSHFCLLVHRSWRVVVILTRSRRYIVGLCTNREFGFSILKYYIFYCSKELNRFTPWFVDNENLMWRKLKFNASWQPTKSTDVFLYTTPLTWPIGGPGPQRVGHKREVVVFEVFYSHL